MPLSATNGEPILVKDGVAKLESVYDERGNLIKRSYFGTNGKPVLHKDGFSTIEADYSETDEITAIRCYDVNVLLIQEIHR